MDLRYCTSERNGLLARFQFEILKTVFGVSFVIFGFGKREMKGIYGIRLKWFGNIWYWIRVLKRFKNMVLDMGHETVSGIHILVSCCRFSRFEFGNLDLV
ncbi:hypothetical protein RIR_jg13816.t1 [Rhizophagus irregularis DAOM 181602=DAOM 197198]|nr:hypothetical protein RIR_jg13816.t1 [Rhizophagus irregularis DAOM 181602=DAOM 197198]